jgi:hypothetical protein
MPAHCSCARDLEFFFKCIKLKLSWLFGGKIARNESIGKDRGKNEKEVQTFLFRVHKKRRKIPAGSIPVSSILFFAVFAESSLFAAISAMGFGFDETVSRVKISSPNRPRNLG